MNSLFPLPLNVDWYVWLCSRIGYRWLMWQDYAACTHKKCQFVILHADTFPQLISLVFTLHVEMSYLIWICSEHKMDVRTLVNSKIFFWKYLKLDVISLSFRVLMYSISKTLLVELTSFQDNIYSYSICVGEAWAKWVPINCRICGSHICWRNWLFSKG